MNRKQKIAFLQEVAKGNRQPLQEMIAASSGDPTFGDIILCFHYLLEHGRPEGQKDNWNPTCYITSPDDLKEVESILTLYGDTNSLSGSTDSELRKLCECQECFEFLQKTGQLHLLNPYRHLLTDSSHE